LQPYLRRLPIQSVVATLSSPRRLPPAHIPLRHRPCAFVMGGWLAKKGR
jgi:hypothetical protein